MRRWARDARGGAPGVRTCACRGAVWMTPSCGVTCVLGHILSNPGFPCLCNHHSYHVLAVRGVKKLKG
eukprot:SAG25_NODE_889_length_4913_cov_47.520980_2_plen_68_part_00